MPTRLATQELLGIVEAAYRVDASDADWLRGIAEACRGVLDEGFGVCAFEFENRTGLNPVSLQEVMVGMPDKLAEIYPQVFRNMDPQVRTMPFLHGPCVTISQLFGGRNYVDKSEIAQYFAKEFKVYDSMWLTAAEPSGWGCGVHVCLPRIRRLSQRAVDSLSRVATHLGAGARLRRRGGVANRAAMLDGSPDAVFSPNGDLQHAEGAAAEENAVQLLRAAVLAVEKVRGEPHDQSTSALKDWKGLVDARWSLVDAFNKEGHRYLVARENAPRPVDLAALTLRERQIVGYACLGHDNKVIAYDLGIAHSTVKVLLARAAAKLGVHSRDELLAKFRARWQATQETTPPAAVEDSLGATQQHG
jgi:DNA-binding CsgD family transcriptional regulator